MTVLSLRFCARAFSSCGKWGPLFIAVRGPLTIAASLAAEHRLQTRRLSNCGSRAQSLRGIWDLPRPGLEPVSPALAGRFSTTAPPGKPYMGVLIESMEMKKMIYWSRFSRNSSLQHIGISNIWLSHQDLQMEILKGEVLGHLKCLEHISCQQPTVLHFHSPVKQKELYASYAGVSSCMHKVSSEIHALNAKSSRERE